VSAAAAVAEMVVNVRDSAVEKLVSQDVILLPKLTVRPAVEQPLSSSSSPADMHQYSDQVSLVTLLKPEFSFKFKIF